MDGHVVHHRRSARKEHVMANISSQKEAESCLQQWIDNNNKTVKGRLRFIEKTTYDGEPVWRFWCTYTNGRNPTFLVYDDGQVKPTPDG